MTENCKMTTATLAPTMPTGRQVAMESLVKDCCIFSWRKKATNPDSYRDSFFALEKNNKTNKLGMKSGNSFKKFLVAKHRQHGSFIKTMTENATENLKRDCFASSLLRMSNVMTKQPID